MIFGHWSVAGSQTLKEREGDGWGSDLGDETSKSTASVVGKERNVVDRTGVSRFIGFLVIPMAGEGSKIMGRKKRGRGRKIEPLPELRWPLRPSISDEHKKRVLRLSRKKRGI